MNNIVIADIDIEVLQKKIKNIHLSVHPPNGRVRLAVPKNMDEEAIRIFAISKLSWIRKQQAKFIIQERQTPREFLSGESHYFLGDRYLLNLLETKGKQCVEINNKKDIDLYVRKNSTKEKREKIMTEWYREELKKIIPGYIKKWEAIMGVEVEEWGVKLMKTRWGSCNINAKRIWINLELAKKNPRCLEYIVVHEMTHLLERKHNDRFKAYMDKFLPNWRSIKAELNGLIFED
ncbi:MAG: M48 family metallopeptidase [Tissierella sp.]|uniref:M48 family metallopeptidase n=1 Tax=Tissierella sp. TaxID=41274 RepID=UPI003F99708A